MKFQKRYLTPDEQAKLDPSLTCRNLIARVPSTDNFAPLPKHISGGEDFLERTKAAVSVQSAAHLPYVRYCQEMFSKLGRQGGMFNRQKWEDSICSYFTGDVTGEIPQVLLNGRDLLIRMCIEIADKYGYPSCQSSKIIPTFGGLPSGLAKGTFAAETLERNVVSIQRFLPTIPGQRRMRSKDRVIFMDATVNVRAQEPYLNGLRYWLRKYLPNLFGAWLDPTIFTAPELTKAVDSHRTFVSWDYNSMDKNFRKRIAMELVYPVYEVLFPDIALSIGAHLEQNFEQPVYMGTYLLEGLHSLLSGANITNDFETIYTIELALGCMAELGLISSTAPVVHALGDDMTVAVSTVQIGKRLLDLAINTSNAVGMEISHEKSSVTKSEVTFCRKVYYPAAKRSPAGVMYGAYPSVLTVNNIVQPENPSESDADALMADLQRMDGCIGSPDFPTLCQAYPKYANLQLINMIPELFKLTDTESWSDWWYRLYGQRWNPATSPALQRIIAAWPGVSHIEKAKLLQNLLK